MSDLYSDAFVRRRLAEYVGEEPNWQPTAAFVSQSDGCAYQRHNLKPARHLRWFLDRDLDIARSLADSESLLLHLDVEYVNFDSPGEALINPRRRLCITGSGGEGHPGPARYLEHQATPYSNGTRSSFCLAHCPEIHHRS